MGKPAALLLLSALLVASSVPAPAQTSETLPDVAHITSDTAAFCHQLAEQAETAPMAGDVRTLHDEGVQLCAIGRLQAGIARLRRALLASRERQSH